MNVVQSLSRKYVTASTIKNTNAASECVDYILSTEADDYFEQAADQGVTQDNWKQKWDTLDHVYVSALQAIGKLPDVTRFEA